MRPQTAERTHLFGAGSSGPLLSIGNEPAGSRTYVQLEMYREALRLSSCKEESALRTEILECGFVGLVWYGMVRYGVMQYGNLGYGMLW